MTIKFRHTCGKKVSCPDHFAGKPIRCPKCSEVVRVPGQVGDHTVAQDEVEAVLSRASKPQDPAEQVCELRRVGQARVVTSSLAELREAVAQGAVSGDDLVRMAGAEAWAPVRTHPEFASDLQDAPSRVGGFNFADPAPQSEVEARALGQGLDERMCVRHADRPAEYFCSRCEKALCRECQNKLRGDIFCPDCTEQFLDELQAYSPELMAEPQEDAAGTETGDAAAAIRATNRAVVIEWLLAVFLSCVGIGWLCCGKALAGLLLLAGNFSLVIGELCVILFGPFRPSSFAVFLMVAVPFILLQNTLVGTISAITLQKSCRHSGRRA